MVDQDASGRIIQERKQQASQAAGVTGADIDKALQNERERRKQQAPVVQFDQAVELPSGGIAAPIRGGGTAIFHKRPLSVSLPKPKIQS